MTPSTNQDSANDNRIGLGGGGGGGSRRGSFNITFEQGHSKSSNITTTIPTTMSISPPQVGPTDRRPSVGCNVIPHAALCQHRHSLQMNGEGGVFRVSFTIFMFIFIVFCASIESESNYSVEI